MRRHLLLSLGLALLATACEQEAAEDTECPAGSGAIFVANGPDGPGCYCPAGTLPNAATQTCDGCPPGYTTRPGSSECQDIDECYQALDDCDPLARCLNNQGGFECVCDSGGLVLVDNACVCPPGTTLEGTACKDIDQCATGAVTCDPNATCSNGFGNDTCLCKAGYEGDGFACTAIDCGPGLEFKLSGTNAGRCGDIDECYTGVDTCSDDAQCFNRYGAELYTCQCRAPLIGDGRTCACPSGYTRGANGSCANINECTTGAISCHADATCLDLQGSALCRCKTGFQGDGFFCAPTPCNAGYETNASGTCVDTDECGNGVADCSPNARCQNTPGSFSCTCAPGFTGDGRTCADVDECATNADDCSQICTNTEGSFECACNAGFVLDYHFCADINECAPSPDQTCLGLCYNSNGSAQCFGDGGISSLADPDNSPYPNMQCAGPVGPEQIWFQANQKTSFPVDCRCPHGSQAGSLLCAAPTAMELANLHLGTGVNAADAPSGEIKGCATDFSADLVYFGVNWANNGDSRRGFIFAMDPATANRTLISGEYLDPNTGVYQKGTGTAFDTILDLALGPDGFLYVFEDSVPGSTAADTSPLFGRSVYRVDLVTGNRTLWWNDRDTAFSAAHCGSPTGNMALRPDIFNHQFELTENGDMLFTVRGNGVIRVANDRSSCSWVTANGAAGPGSGFDMPALDSGWGYKDGVIYGTSFLTGAIYKINVATGVRTRIFGDAAGTGPGPGVWSFFYLPYLQLWVAGGNEAQTPSDAALFDPASGDTWGWMYQRPDPETGSGSGGQNVYAGPINTNPTNQLRGPILGTNDGTLIDRPWCLSPLAENRLFVATDRVGIVIVELETGNTMNFSQ